MVRAWFMDSLDTEQQLEHHLVPPQFISTDVLVKTTGIEYFQVNLETHEDDGVVEEIKKANGYTQEDKSSCSKKCFPDYKEAFKTFFAEHLHTDDEVRLILEGSAYFDVRDNQDKWVRIEVTPGDMIVIPSGIYHRFTLDANYYIKAKRFFVDTPNSPFFHRPADDMDCRKSYLKKLSNGVAPESIVN